MLELLIGLEDVASELMDHSADLINEEESIEAMEYSESISDGSMDLSDDYYYEGDE